MVNKQGKGNIAYIDAQNLRMATIKAKDNPWDLDLGKFRRYLRERFNVETAYYFIGIHRKDLEDVYLEIEEAGYIIRYRLHNEGQTSPKKGNVDVDITFSMLTDLYEKGETYNQAILVSNDGDYIRVVKHLISKDKMRIVLLPKKRYASSLYKRLDWRYYAYLDREDVKRLIGK